MARRMLWLLVAACIAVLFFFAQSWILDRKAETETVGWSPLYDHRVTEALVPLTSQVAYGQQSVANQCDTRDCQETWDCQETFYCEETFDCEETIDCETAGGECATLEETCEGARTCEGYSGHGSTIDCATCAGHPDCDTGDTYEGAVCTLDGPECGGETWEAPGCTWDAPGCTWDGPACDEPSMVPWECGGPTLRRTCIGGVLVRLGDDLDFEAPLLETEPCVPGPTYEGPTCVRPTCDGPTCEGVTCSEVDCEAWDFGDAPDFADSSYHYDTSLDNDGARHRFFGIYYLGNGTDPEMDGRPSALAVGDDAPEWTARDDEDGIWFVSTLVPGEPAVAIAHASRSGSLRAWIDYDESGRWDRPDEDIFGESIRLAPGYNWVTFVVPETAVPDVSFGRFRFGANAIPQPHGPDENGEVEDYRVPVCERHSAWVMTDDLFYRPGDDIRVRFYLNETSQVTIVRHFPDGAAEHVWAGTLEAGRHEYTGQGLPLFAEPVFGVTTLELIVTSLQSGCTSWLSTPYSVVVR